MAIIRETGTLTAERLTYTAKRIQIRVATVITEGLKTALGSKSAFMPRTGLSFMKSRYPQGKLVGDAVHRPTYFLRADGLSCT